MVENQNPPDTPPENVPPNIPTGEVLLYLTEDGQARVECRFEDDTIWLSQALMGSLFDRSKQTISEHLNNLFDEGELDENSVVRKFRTTDGQISSVGKC